MVVEEKYAHVALLSFENVVEARFVVGEEDVRHAPTQDDSRVLVGEAPAPPSGELGQGGAAPFLYAAIPPEDQREDDDDHRYHRRDRERFLHAITLPPPPRDERKTTREGARGRRG